MALKSALEYRCKTMTLLRRRSVSHNVNCSMIYEILATELFTFRKSYNFNATWQRLRILWFANVYIISMFILEFSIYK